LRRGWAGGNPKFRIRIPKSQRGISTRVDPFVSTGLIRRPAFRNRAPTATSTTVSKLIPSPVAEKVTAPSVSNDGRNSSFTVTVTVVSLFPELGLTSIQGTSLVAVHDRR
jgi:hypothetical protein